MVPKLESTKRAASPELHERKHKSIQFHHAGEQTSSALSRVASGKRQDTSSSQDSGSSQRNKRDVDEKTIPTSSISLSEFRRRKPQLYWPSRHKDRENDGPILIDETRKNPDPLFKEERQDCGWTKKSQVYSAKFLKVNGNPEHLAVKLVPLEEKNKDTVKKEFLKLAKLDHAHIIAAVGNFTEESKPGSAHFGILLFPLASMDMEKFLLFISDHNSRRTTTSWRMFDGMDKLVSYFACLCQAVMYLHDLQEPIKHRDIKPANILIDGQGEVLLADFDIAKQYTTREMTHTGGYTIKTDFYCPPHVRDDEVRGLEWDICSLGYCFLDMATVIFGETIENLRVDMNENSYADFVSDGGAIRWVKKLKDHCTDLESSQWPRHNFVESRGSETQVDDFFHHISKMMLARPSQHQHELDATDVKTPQNDHILRSAWGCFTRLCQSDCENCARYSLLRPPVVTASPRLLQKDTFANSDQDSAGVHDTRGGASDPARLASDQLLRELNPTSEGTSRPQSWTSWTEMPRPDGTMTRWHSPDVRLRSPSGHEGDAIYEEPDTRTDSQPTSPALRPLVPIDEDVPPAAILLDTLKSEEPIESVSDRQDFAPQDKPALEQVPSNQKARHDDMDLLDVARGFRVVFYEPRRKKYSLITKKELRKHHLISADKEHQRLRGWLFKIPRDKHQYINLEDPASVIQGFSEAKLDPRQKYWLLVKFHIVSLLFVPRPSSEAR